MMTRPSAIILLAAAGTLLVPGCKPSTGGSNASTAASTEDGNVAGKAKLNGYTAAINLLIGQNGFKTSRDAFDGIFQGEKKTDIPSPSTTEVPSALATLRQARALSGGAPDLDQAADKLASALGTLVTHVNNIKPYYDSKAYLEDGSKRGQAEEPVVRAEFATAAAALDTFIDLVERERRAADTIEMARLKADGRLVAYNAMLMLQQGEGIVTLFGSEADVRDPAKYAQADTQVAALEKTLADQRVAIASEKTSGKLNERMAENETDLTGRLTKLVGDYRTMKQNKDKYSHNFMVVTYNDVVMFSNIIRR